MNKPKVNNDSIPMDSLMDVLESQRSTAKASRDNIPLGAPEPSQKNWQFFNGQVRAIDSIESHLRLYMDTILNANKPEPPPEPDKNPCEQVEPGLMIIRCSNGSHLTLEEGEDELALYDGMPGEGAWMATITKDGILCSPNSGSSCADLVLGLKEQL